MQTIHTHLMKYWQAGRRREIRGAGDHSVRLLAAAAPALPTLPITRIADVVATVGVLVLSIGLIATGVTLTMRWTGLAWSWGAPLMIAAPLALPFGWEPVASLGSLALGLLLVGGIWHHRDLWAGGDLADRARARCTPMDLVRSRVSWWQIRHGRWVTDEGVAIGIDRRGRLVRAPICGRRPAMGLTPGATGSGKSVTMTLIATAAILKGLAVVLIDPKGDDFMLDELRSAARRAHRRLNLWTPGGGAVYNPYEHGSDTEVADKLLAGETFTEPHYQRLAQRYLGHVVRALRSAGVPTSLASIVEHMEPARLASLARELPPESAGPLVDYLETLTPQQERELAGTRDRLATVSESDMARWLDPGTPGESVDLRESLKRGDVVIFRLETDRRPLAAPMVGAAVVQDLVAISAERQHGDHRPALVVMDEFSGFAAKQVVRLFSRSRGAGFSQLLGTQELSDLAAVLTDSGSPGGIRDQVLGNLDVIIAHRQAVPESAEMVAAIAGTRGAWITTQQTGAGLNTGLGSRTRGREYKIHPDDIKSLGIGMAAVIVSRVGRATIARIIHPSELRRRGRRC